MRIATTVRSIASVFREEKITFIAAGVAYYAFFSVVPLLLLTLAVGSLVGGQAFADRVVSLVEAQLSDQGVAVVERALTSTAGRGGGSVVGLLGLAWSALKVFRGLDLAFAEVYGDVSDTSVLRQIVDGTAVAATVGLAVALMVGLGAILSRPALVDVPHADLLGWSGLVAGLFVAFLPVYYVLPPVDVSFREILPGAALASVGWLALQALFRLYAANASQYSAFGFLGAVLLFLTWLYVASLLVVLGAIVNAVLAGRA